VVPNRYGNLTLIVGPMFSGKTQRLRWYLERRARARQKVILFRRDTDTRARLTHGPSPVFSSPYFLEESVPSLPLSPGEAVSAVGLDEAQFFAREILPRVESWREVGIDVYCSGLARDSERNSFGFMGELLIQATHTECLTAICVNCGREATESASLLPKTEQVRVGAEEIYQALCMTCYAHFTKKQ
jgi:thymidine kinase